MSQFALAVADQKEPMTLPPALADRLTAYARARGMREEDAIRRALDLLFREPGHAEESGDHLPELAAPPDWEVEVPVVAAVRPKSSVRVDARVVRCQRRDFVMMTDGVLPRGKDRASGYSRPTGSTWRRHSHASS